MKKKRIDLAKRNKNRRRKEKKTRFEEELEKDIDDLENFGRLLVISILIHS